MIRLGRRASLLLTFFVLMSAAMACAESGWVLWRHVIPADNPRANDERMWQSQPGNKTKEQCESAAKEYRAKDPDKPLLDSNGRAYRIEYLCAPATITPRVVL